jgi:hypothetical protein
MRQRSTIQPEVGSSNSVVSVVITLALVGMMQTGCTGCRVAQSATPSQRLEEALKRAELKRAEAHLNTPSGAGPECPLLGSAQVASTPPANGGHRVTLSWTASAPGDSKHSAAFGYCIYRTAVGEAQTGLINKTPFQGTSCTDDLVVNGKRYSYVVRAISDKQVPSITSNTAPVDIPAAGASHPPISGNLIPLCRGAAAAK